MNPSFDYNGHVVAPSKPQKVLRTVKKVIHINSKDRDSVKYPNNGEWVAYLPRVYKNVVSIRLISATFPPVNAASSPGALTHSYHSISLNDTSLTNESYFLIELKGLNKSDECVEYASKSTFTDGYFALINAPISNYYKAGDGTTGLIVYSDKNDPDNIGRYSPPIENLDRLSIKTRLHSQQGNKGYIYWTDDGTVNGSTTSNVAQYTMTFEIEYLENGFDEFSSFETRVGSRS